MAPQAQALTVRRAGDELHLDLAGEWRVSSLAAMDKALGSLLLEGLWPLPGVVACLSGRAGFELIQKASLAGLAGVVAVGAPTSLAIQLAEERDMLLCGFVRESSCNVYAGAGRLAPG